jgi:Fe(3+) dicitrate transport protein
MNHNKTFMKTKMKFTAFCLIILMLLPFSAFNSNNILTGRVVNNNKGVPFVAVYVEGSKQGVSTDANGNFSLQIDSSENIVLGVKGLGYKTTTQSLNAGLGQNLIIEIEEDVLMLDQVMISGSRIGILRYLPGSASIISHNDLRSSVPLSGNEVLRNVAGVHVVEEEGAGLRTNIGIRGLDPDKSRNVLILEDGVPVALAPYGEPEMYFTPSIDRMSGVEILKGSGSILFGPQTIGGVINYLTADAPESFNGNFTFQAGDKGFYNARIAMGNTIENFGFTVNFQRKQAENFGPTAFLFHDFNTKLQSRISPVSLLSMKISVYDENSNSTYVGLTEPMYRTGQMDDYRLTPDDHLHIRRYAVSAIHKYSPLSNLQFNTTAFAYTTARNWNRQDFSYSASATNIVGGPVGSPEEIEGAIYLRNSTGQRNRQFEVAGIEPRMSANYSLAGIQTKTDAGVRYLYEKAYEQRVNGTAAGYRSGNLRDDEIRYGQTVSAFVQNKFLLSEKLAFTAGVRNENIWYGREIMRVSGKDTLITANSEVFTVIPGAGINYNISSSVGLFAGIHRGFAPPRTKDAISNEGVDLQLEAEKSWNSELGARIKAGKMELEYTLFHMNFSNQIIPVSESSGGLGTGYINGGATLHRGMELSLLLPLDDFLPEKWGAQLSYTGTWVNSTFSGDRYVLAKQSINKAQFQDEYVNINGYKTPYAPELTMAVSFIVENAAGWGVRSWLNYTGSQFTDALNTVNVYDWIDADRADPNYKYVQGTASGRIGKLDPHVVANVSAWYEHSGTGLGFNIGVKNLFNERYIASRRPQGIRAGMPRFISAGITYKM